ncbi:MAG: hypothetical protein ACM34K_00600 [Bacillota bacterium]
MRSNSSKKNIKYQENISANNIPSPKEIEWSPLNSVNLSFITRRAILIEKEVLIFVPTKRAIASYILFIVICGFILITTLLDNSTKASVIVLFSILFLASIIFLWAGIKPIIFNKKNNLYYSSWTSPKGMKEQNSVKWKYVPLNEIHSIQILSYLIPKSHDGYELNIVLKDSSRVYVTGHKNIKQIFRDAAILSEFLDVPIWKFIGNVTNF